MEASTQREIVNVEATVDRKIYDRMALRIMKLLGSGCTQEEASRAVGCDPSYIAQLMGEIDFRSQVNEIVKKTFEEQSKIDDTYLEIEKKMSERLLSITDSVWSPDSVLRVLKFANEAKRKVAPASRADNPGANGSGGTTVVVPVTLVVPMQVAKEFILNPNNEIVGLNGQELTTLPSANINKLVADKKEQVKLELKKSNGAGTKQDPWSDL